MKTAAAIARFVLGLVFVVFGLNGFLNFMPMGPVPALAGQFAGALIQSHYMAVVLTIAFHIFMAPAGLPIAAIVAALWVVSAYPYRALMSPLFRRRFDGVERAESLLSPRNSIARSA